MALKDTLHEKNVIVPFYKILAEGPGVARGKKNLKKNFDFF